MSFLARRPLAASLALGAAGAIAACTTSNTASTYTPYTGIDIPTASITAGFGCSAADGSPGGGVDHYVAVLAYATPTALSLADVPPSALVAAGIFSCFTPTATFENVDAAASFDVWVFGFPPGVPANLPCAEGTCVLSGIDAWTALVEDQDAAILPGQAPTVALRCFAVAELGSHPSAYGCHPVGTGAPSGSSSTADASADGDADAAAPEGGGLAADAAAPVDGSPPADASGTGAVSSDGSSD